MSIEGALLKITQQTPDVAVRRGTSFELPVQILRAKKLASPVLLELVVPPEYANALTADPLTVPVGQDQAQLHVNVSTDTQVTGEIRFMVRGTAMDALNLPVVARASETIAVE